jgi:GNAT superfamily N-acetyltransferase
MSFAVQNFVPTKETVQGYVKFQHRIAKRHPNTSFLPLNRTFDSLLKTGFIDQQQQFIAQDSRQVVGGHVVARVAPDLSDENRYPLGMLGFYDCEDQWPIAQSLLGRARDWLKQQGCRVLIGPMDGNTWQRYRFNIGPYDSPPFLSEPTNPDYYPDQWRRFGFAAVESYHSRRIDDLREVLPVVERSAAKAHEAGYRFRTIRLDDFEQELGTIFEISTQSFGANRFYCEIPKPEFLSLYRPARQMVDPDLIWFALDATGSEVGFLFCIEDFGPAVEAMRGKSNWWAKLKFLAHRKWVDAVNFKSIAVIPAHRRTHVAAALMYHGYQAALSKRYQHANLCLIHDNNPSSKLDGGKSRILRRYELYRMTVD